MPLTTVSGEASSLYTVALPFFTAIGASALTYLGVRRTSIAPLRAEVNDAFRTWMHEAQEERARDTVRILELEAEILRQRREINQHLQIIQSTQAELERARGN